ncbi:uncharacterized protein TRAVEDRAFT_43111 [Trametes versicolor FP-101664 SS1]|uniref:uncharacterized protein n=1 Tax=Trametes versicolor (strain FP-101664) TaxID=717944 RepID=UPI0004621E8F|nr:uncharacterized protein TRAVEDRAFT_43111 [Trametes versicolor FP-101664 SS1]EIW62785.1 hypothetical protein TRAVEDRAFT_43111 [Trametes versicolor FP-101664 SS1]
MAILAEGHSTTEVYEKRFSAPKERESTSTARPAITLAYSGSQLDADTVDTNEASRFL